MSETTAKITPKTIIVRVILISGLLVAAFFGYKKIGYEMHHETDRLGTLCIRPPGIGENGEVSLDRLDDAPGWRAESSPIEG